MKKELNWSYTMSLKYCVRFSGSSNYGLKQAARILAEAAAIYGDKFALESASFGPEARSNIARADVIISDEAIDSPRIKVVDFLLVLTQDAFDKYIDDLSAKGIVITDVDIDTFDQPEESVLYKIPFFEIIEKDIEKYSLISIFVLGIFAAISEVVNEKSIKLAIIARTPKLSEKKYMKAFEAGMNTGKEQRIEKNE